MNVRTLVGQHDTGLFDRANPVRVTETLGRNVNAAEAGRLTQANKGAEMLIEKKAADGSKTYDVYALGVEGKEGKSLTSVDIFENVAFEENLAQKYHGTQAIISPANESQGSGQDFVSYWNVRPDLGKSWDGLKYSAMATTYNLLSFASGGNGVGPWTLGQVYMNESFRYESEKAAPPAKPPTE